jgi:hypothetical protein
VLRDWKANDPIENQRTMRTYAVKVGDVCFVAVGQIVGRRYSAVRYQPTACIVINSAAEDAALARAVRELWGVRGPDARQALLASLLTDYATRAEPDADWDACDVASDVQSRAATRLMYYFPAEAAPMVAQRLDGLDVTQVGPPKGQRSTDAELKAWVGRERRNGVRAESFVKSVAWSRDPVVVAAMDRLRRRATDKDVLDAAGGR